MIDLVAVNNTLINLGELGPAYDAGYITLVEDTGLQLDGMSIYVAHTPIHEYDGIVTAVVVNSEDNMYPDRAVVLAEFVFSSMLALEQYIVANGPFA